MKSIKFRLFSMIIKYSKTLVIKNSINGNNEYVQNRNHHHDQLKIDKIFHCINDESSSTINY